MQAWYGYFFGGKQASTPRKKRTIVLKKSAQQADTCQVNVRHLADCMKYPLYVSGQPKKNNGHAAAPSPPPPYPSMGGDGIRVPPPRPQARRPSPNRPPVPNPYEHNPNPHAQPGYREAPPYASSGPVMRRFPPVLQFLTKTNAQLEHQLNTVCDRVFTGGGTLEQVCSEVHQAAQRMGYLATIGVKEVYSSEMPSFPNETVMSALLIIDLRPGPMYPGNYYR